MGPRLADRCRCRVLAPIKSPSPSGSALPASEELTGERELSENDSFLGLLVSSCLLREIDATIVEFFTFLGVPGLFEGEPFLTEGETKEGLAINEAGLFLVEFSGLTELFATFLMARSHNL